MPIMIGSGLMMVPLSLVRRFAARRSHLRHQFRSEPRPHSGRNEKLEPDAGKLASPVLRGGDGGNTVPLPGDTVLLERLYVFFFIELSTRRVVFAGCTAHPSQDWVAQQARNMAWHVEDVQVPANLLIRDRDCKFTPRFDEVFRATGVRVVKTPPKAPRANSIAERWVQTARREALDRILIFSERHLCTVVAEFTDHYNRARPHRGLGLKVPVPDEDLVIGGRIVRRVRLGDLINEYSRSAA